MNISILGSGNVGSALAAGWVKAGHAVLFGSRDPHTDKVKAACAATGATAGTYAEALAFAEVIALATPGSTDLSSFGGDWHGKIVIDTMNRFSGGGSLALEVAATLSGSRVVKCFNTIGANLMASPTLQGQAASMFYCGDDPTAKQIVGSLAADLGFDPVDVGPLNNAALLENMAQLWVWMARNGYGRDIAFKLLRG